MLAPLLLVVSLLSVVHSHPRVSEQQYQQECSNRTILESYFGKYLRARQWKEVAVIAADGPTDVVEELYVEFHLDNDKIFLKTLDWDPQYLRACPNGSVDLAEPQTPGEDEWQEFQPFKNKDGSWSLRSHHGRWLSVDANGNVRTVKQREALEHFWFKTKRACYYPTVYDDNWRPVWGKLAGDRVLKSAHKTYLSAVDYKDRRSVNLAHSARESEHWLVEMRGQRVVFISSRGNYLHAFANGKVNVMNLCPQSHPSKSRSCNDKVEETWLPIENADGTWGFQSAHGRWLSAGEDGKVSTVEHNGPWENWVLEDWY